MADPAQIDKAIEKYYGEDSESVSDILKDLGSDADIAREASAAAADADNAAALADLANDAPIVRFVNLVLFQAVQDRASDIHFEPFEDEFKIRYRVDGALYEMAPPPKHLALPVVSRIKVMANLNISERRLPQDGRITFTIGNRTIDLRVSTLPTQFGESVVLRVLDRSAVNLEIEIARVSQVPLRLRHRSHPAAQRHFHRHRPDRLRQDHHALFLPAPRQHHRFQAAHRRGPGRIRHRRHHAGGDQRSGRHDLQQGAALLPAPGPGHHHGG